MDSFFLTITWLGSLYVLVPLTVVLAVLLRSAHRLPDLVLLVGGQIGLSVLVRIIKLLVARPRPQVERLLVVMPTDYSFPSAHTAQITALACAVALIFTRNLPPRATAFVWIGLGSLALLVAISRVYLGVHYISDVAAGAVLGTIWIFFLQWFLEQKAIWR